MLARMVSGKRVGCCGTRAIWERRVGVWRRRMSVPPTKTVGDPSLERGA